MLLSIATASYISNNTIDKEELGNHKMPIIHGTHSKYLIWNRNFRRISTFVWLIFFIFSYGYGLLHWMSNLSNWPRLLAVAVVYGPLILFLKKMIEKELGYFICFKQGYKGELETASNLLRLSDNYHLFLDCRLPDKKENIDFVVLGPSGLFTIESKSQKGKIEYLDNNLTINKKPFINNPLNQVARQYWGLHDHIKAETSKDIYITPILVFSNDYASIHFGKNKIRNIYIIQKRWLTNIIVNNMGILQPNKINLLIPVLDQLTTTSEYDFEN